jgi:hypothetical protein
MPGVGNSVVSKSDALHLAVDQHSFTYHGTLCSDRCRSASLAVRHDS